MSNDLESPGGGGPDGVPGGSASTDLGGPATPLRRGWNRGLIAVVVILALIALTGGCLVVANAVAGSPDLVFVNNDPSAVGGSAQVDATVSNSGAGDAQNVGVEVTLAVGAGLTASASIPNLAHGTSVPFKASIDLAGGSLPGDVQPSWKSHWDVAKLDSQKETGSFTYGSHVFGTRAGTLHNAGPADAKDVVLTVTFSSDLDGKNVLNTGTSDLGTIAAGAAAPYSIRADLGANAPSTVYWDWQANWSEPNVSAADIKTAWIGGTVTLTGSVTNRGKAAASDVVVVRTFMDANGRSMGSVTANLGRLAPGARANYKLMFQLGRKSFPDVKFIAIKLSWKETHFFVVTTTQART